MAFVAEWIRTHGVPAPAPPAKDKAGKIGCGKAGLWIAFKRLSLFIAYDFLDGHESFRVYNRFVIGFVPRSLELFKSDIRLLLECKLHVSCAPRHPASKKPFCVEVFCNLPGCVSLKCHAKNLLHLHFSEFVRHEFPIFQPIPDRDLLAAVVLSFFGGCLLPHVHPFFNLLPLQLGENCQNPHHCPTERRGRVEIL